MNDVIIVGGGPAGLSAAISARQRNKTVVVISNNAANSGLFKAQQICDYPGFPTISGPELLQKLKEHALAAGAELATGRVDAILPSEDLFSVGSGSAILMSRSLILATGITQTSLFPGEEEFLGRGVSYCATCDGMLFRGKRICVVCLASETEKEADYLESIGCDVIRLNTNDVKINGEGTVTSVTADGEEIQCSGVFILRQTIAPSSMLADMETEDGHVRAGPLGETNIPGVFAAGDCVGAPYKIAKAVGQGQVAAMSAIKYIDTKGENEK
ncbi:MAG: FAD-dependent oxidoreductase [Oscillospiraceae bacterium]|nr:FAD-dependent oxidoreductase [Oscillospiraceae bacterium]